MRLSLAVLTAGLLGSAHAGYSSIRKRAETHIQAHKERLAARHATVHAESPLEKRAAKCLNDKTKRFAVDGAHFPGVDFDIGESYAGLLPVSGKKNETKELFFWYFPSSNPAASEEVVIWLNGGPGCSSLSGLLTENGPFTWEAGTLSPVQNAYSWTNLTNMIWVEQPVGVGYDEGTPDITNEVQLAEEFAGFWKNWINTFDAHGWDVYVTGESYAGVYVPYIADGFLNKSDTTYYNLKGISVNDPVTGADVIQTDVAIPQYLQYWAPLLNLNDTFLSDFYAKADSCGFTQYFEKYFTFPPPGPLPFLPDPYDDPNYNCDIFDDAFYALLEVNPCFNIYHISDQCPHPWSVLGGVNVGDYIPPGEVVFFNRSDVKAALHAKQSSNWQQCTDVNVFGNGSTDGSGSDQSLAPGQDGVLQRVIEATNNTIIGSGDLDMLIATNGTLLAIQNITWHGLQGFQSYPGTPLYVPYHPDPNGGSLAGAGILGSWGTERGLTFYHVQLSGHELPGYAPGAGYRMLEILLGRIENFSSTDDFTTQTGNFTGSTPLYRR